MVRALIAALLIVLAIGLGACAGISPVAGDRVVIAKGLSVQASPVWNRMPRGTLGAGEAWTQDGLPLDHILFLAGRDDGEPLFERSRVRKSLQFRASMTPTEIADLWASEWTLAGLQQVEVGRLKPAGFAGHPGFRFQFAYWTPEGLAFDGIAAGAVVAGRLYLIAFSGTRAHHFVAHWPAAVDVIGSAHIAQG